MSVTPLFTAAELDAQIAAYKTALTALASMAEYTMDIGGIRQTVRKADLSDIRTTLQFLQAERVKLEAGHGPQFIQGRVYRG